MGHSPTGKRVFSYLALAVAAFAVWLSLIPFNFQPVAWADIPSRIAGLGDPLPSRLPRSDVVANSAVFVVFGLCLTAAFTLDRQGRKRAAAAFVAAVAVSLALSATLEFLQVFLPWRVASLIDVAAQLAGTAAGAAAWLLFGQPVVDAFRTGAKGREQPAAVTRLLAVYALVLIVVRLFPFDFSASLSELAFKVRVGMVAIVPFGTLAVGPQGIFHVLERMATAIPLGALGLLLGVHEGKRRTITQAVVYATAFLALIELLKAFSTWRYADSGNVLVGAVGAAIGAGLAAAWSGRSVARIDWGGAEATRRAVRALRFAFVAWLLVVCFYEWYPFEFDFARRSVRAAINRATIIPFLNYLRAPVASAASDALSKILVSFPLGVIVSALASRRWPHAARSVVLLAAVGATSSLFFVLEAGQVFLPSRVPDATDVLLPAASALLAAWLVTGRDARAGWRSFR